MTASQTLIFLIWQHGGDKGLVLDPWTDGKAGLRLLRTVGQKASSTPQLPWLTFSLVYTESSKAEPWAVSNCALQVMLSWRRKVFSSGGPSDTQMKMLLCHLAQATLSPWERGRKNAHLRYRLFFGSWACFFHPGSISLRRIWALAFHEEVFLFLVFRACLSYHLLGHFFCRCYKPDL